MILTYTRRDADAWAAFSGDDNPIHFDPERARALGADGLSGHGMRAMLDIKQQLSEALLHSSPQGRYYLFNARLRQPLICDKPYLLTLTGGSERVRLSAKVTREDHALCFSAKLAAAKPLEPVLRSRAVHYSAGMLRALSERFPLPLDAPGQAWNFVDAVLFQCLVAAPETLLNVAEVFPGLQVRSLSEIFRQVPVVQTHHDVHFDAGLLMTDVRAIVEGGLHCAVQPPVIAGAEENGYVLGIVIRAWTGDGPLLSSSVTLKTLPIL